MGKSKKRNRSRSTSGERKLKKRIEKLEKELKEEKYFHKHRPRSRRRNSSSSSHSRSRSPIRGATTFETDKKKGEVRHRSRRHSGSGSNLSPKSCTSSTFRRLSVDRRLNSPARARFSRDRDLHSTASTSGIRYALTESNINLDRQTEDDILSLHDTGLEEVAIETDLPENILQILGDDPNLTKKHSFVLHDAIQSRWSHILCHGLDKESKITLLARHNVPENCPLLEPPKINPEIVPILSQAYLKRDTCHAHYQEQIAKGLSALGKAINPVLENTQNASSSSEDSLLPSLIDAGRILADLFRSISSTRRTLITQTVNKGVKDIIEKTTPGEFLFGPNLGEKIQTAKSLERAGRDLRPPTSAFPQAASFSEGRGGASRPYHLASQRTTQSLGRRPQHYSRAPNLNIHRPAHPRRVMRPAKGQTPRRSQQSRFKR